MIHAGVAVVPDNPWSIIYHQPATRAAAAALETGATDEEAWQLYVDTYAAGTPEAVRALNIARSVYGKRTRKPRPKRTRATKL